MAKVARSLNTHDLLDDLPWAQWGPACQAVHVEGVRREIEEQSRSNAATAIKRASGSAVTSADLEIMFPTMDPVLVRTILAEAAAPQQAIEILLTLSASVVEPAGVPAPSEIVSVDDQEAFPILVDANGWQLVNTRALSNDDGDQKVGNTWRNRAKAAAGLPQQKLAKPTAKNVRTRRRPGLGCSLMANAACEESVIVPAPTLATEYDFRQQKGQRRAACRSNGGANVLGGGSGVARDDCDELNSSCSDIETQVSPSMKGLEGHVAGA
jgi:hypothetical protein